VGADSSRDLKKCLFLNPKSSIDILYFASEIKTPPANIIKTPVLMGSRQDIKIGHFN